MKTRILVTGGAGYVGSHACKVLAAAGYEPVVYDNLGQGHAWAVRWGPLVVGDLADRLHLRETIETFGIRAALHFAAHAYVGESVLKPGKYFSNNVGNTLTLLECLVDAGVRIFGFSSSCAAFGVPEVLPIREDHPQNPISPYGESKLMVERILPWYGAAYGLRYAILRYFNAAGADQDGELGEDHDPETHLIPLAIAAAQGRLPYLEIFGTDYATGDGTAIRDYVHVTDLAEAHVKALEALIMGKPSGSYNLGTGDGHSIREVIKAVEAIGGRPVPIIEARRRPGDPAALVACAARAATELQWRASQSDLRHIVQTAWSWHERSHPKVAAPVGEATEDRAAAEIGSAAGT